MSCNNGNQREDVVNQVNQDGAVETRISINHQNGLELLTTTHHVWVKGKIEKTITRTDTLPALGIIQADGEDNEGRVHSVPVKKEYEHFITVQ
jgi:hypothetical protein